MNNVDQSTIPITRNSAERQEWLDSLDYVLAPDGEEEATKDKEKENKKDDDQEAQAKDKDEDSRPKKKTDSAEDAKSRGENKPAGEDAEEVRSKEEKSKARADAKCTERDSKDEVDAKPDKEPADVTEDVIPAGPATRRLARELGVELRSVAASRPDTRLTEQHIKAFVRENLRSDATTSRGMLSPPRPDSTRCGDVDRVSRTTVEKRTAERMTTAWSVAPQVTHCDTVDIGRVEEVRRRYAARAGDDRPRLTVTAFLVKAAVIALRDLPKFNASLDVNADELVLTRYCHIGVAVDTDAGLVVPVIRNCDRKTIVQIAVQLQDIAQRTRDRNIGLDELRGGTFTITNVGGIGGTVFTPILNWPQVAILGATRARRVGVFDNGRRGDRLELPLCLSFDHRVINGAGAARFTKGIASALSDPELMLLES